MNKKNFQNTFILWLPVLLWAVIIFSLSSVQTIKVTEVFLWDFLIKKSAHLAEFGILFALIFRATRRNWILSIFLSLVYAFSDELHQSFVPGRNSSVLDLVIDLSGINIAGYIIWKLKLH